MEGSLEVGASSVITDKGAYDTAVEDAKAANLETEALIINQMLWDRKNPRSAVKRFYSRADAEFAQQIVDLFNQKGWTAKQTRYRLLPFFVIVSIS